MKTKRINFVLGLLLSCSVSGTRFFSRTGEF